MDINKIKVGQKFRLFQGKEEESEKAIKYFKDVIKKIKIFKRYHEWTLWNIVNKFLEFRLDDHKLKVKEVKT